MTSLMGFEALLRGIPVTTLGTPFYAGWGLTTDLGPIPKLQKLENLSLNYNKLGKLPPDIGKMTNLKQRALAKQHRSSSSSSPNKKYCSMSNRTNLGGISPHRPMAQSAPQNLRPRKIQIEFPTNRPSGC